MCFFYYVSLIINIALANEGLVIVSHILCFHGIRKVMLSKVLSEINAYKWHFTQWIHTFSWWEKGTGDMGSFQWQSERIKQKAQRSKNYREKIFLFSSLVFLLLPSSTLPHEPSRWRNSLRICEILLLALSSYVLEDNTFKNKH